MKRDGQRENTLANRSSPTNRTPSGVQRRLLVACEGTTLQSSVLENRSLIRRRNTTTNPPNSPDGDYLDISRVTARNPFAARHINDSEISIREQRCVAHLLSWPERVVPLFYLPLVQRLRNLGLTSETFGQNQIHGQKCLT